MVITYSRVWINRVRLPILLVVSLIVTSGQQYNVKEKSTAIYTVH